MISPHARPSSGRATWAALLTVTFLAGLVLGLSFTQREYRARLDALELEVQGLQELAQERELVQRPRFQVAPPRARWGQDA